MKTYKQFIFESEEARKDLYEGPLAIGAGLLGAGMLGWGAYDTYRSAKKFIKKPSLEGGINVGIDALGMIPYAGGIIKPLKNAKRLQQLGAAGEGAGWVRDAANSAGYLKNLATDVKTHGPALGRRWNDFLNKDGDALLDTKKYQAQANQERIERAREQEAERVRKQDDTPAIEPTITILQQPQKDGSVKRTDVTDTTPPSTVRQQLQPNQQPSTSQQQTPAPQPPEKKKRNGSNMTNWDRLVPPGMVMPGGRK